MSSFNGERGSRSGSSCSSIWVDTDGGIDDAAALMLLFGQEHVTCRGVSCVFGIVDVHQAAKNMARIRQLCGKDSSVPMYIGATKPLQGQRVPEGECYGQDGLGDVPNQEPPADSVHMTSVALVPKSGITEGEVANVSAARELVVAAERAYSTLKGKKLTLVALGPLTNIALAMGEARDFPKWIEQLVVVGGALADDTHFNTRQDPLAAHYVFKHWKERGGSNILLLPKEVNVSHQMPLRQFEAWAQMQKPTTQKARFLKAILHCIMPSSKSHKQRAEEWSMGLRLDDMLAMAAVLFPQYVTKQGLFKAEIAVEGADHVPGCLLLKRPDASPNTVVVAALDNRKVWEAFMDCVSEDTQRYRFLPLSLLKERRWEEALEVSIKVVFTLFMIGQLRRFH